MDVVYYSCFLSIISSTSSNYMFEWTSLEFAISSGTFASSLDTSSQLMCQSSGRSQYTSEQKFGHNAEIMPL
ncbi:unnamed protein product [Trifolium pratense]|uniref:Uncharacterized protein n=1 Tax=Trifolium pratense TaxID=57577 RepID=A0ACB0K4V2_TRIPR|nr:unnamed protein product [Trifolium pratense]